jgi:hypothetical protein
VPLAFIHAPNVWSWVWVVCVRNPYDHLRLPSLWWVLGGSLRSHIDVRYEQNSLHNSCIILAPWARFWGWVRSSTNSKKYYPFNYDRISISFLIHHWHSQIIYVVKLMQHILFFLLVFKYSWDFYALNLSWYRSLRSCFWICANSLVWFCFCWHWRWAVLITVSVYVLWPLETDKCKENMLSLCRT